MRASYDAGVMVAGLALAEFRALGADIGARPRAENTHRFLSERGPDHPPLPGSAFAKLGIREAPEDNRRVVAVLAYLRR